MATHKDRSLLYPQEVRSSTRRPMVVYTLLPNHYALHHQSDDMPSSHDAVSVMSDGRSLIEVFQRKAETTTHRASLAKIGPVYTLHPSGTLAIPTGRVFIRFPEGVRVEDRLQDIERAGYEIAQSLAYAPHSAWLRARSGEIGDALTHISALEQIAGVENIEPQMLIQKSNR